LTIIVAVAGVVLGALPYSVIYKHIASEMLTEAQPTNTTESGFVILRASTVSLISWPKREEDGAHATLGMDETTPVALAGLGSIASAISLLGFPWLPSIAVSTRLNGWAATRGSVLLVSVLAWLTHTMCVAVPPYYDATGELGPNVRDATQGIYYLIVLFGAVYIFTKPLTEGGCKRRGLMLAPLFILAVQPPSPPPAGHTRHAHSACVWSCWMSFSHHHFQYRHRAVHLTTHTHTHTHTRPHTRTHIHSPQIGEMAIRRTLSNYFATDSALMRFALRSVMLPACKYIAIHVTLVSGEQLGFAQKENLFLLLAIPMGLLVAAASVMQLGASSPLEALAMQFFGEYGSLR